MDIRKHWNLNAVMGFMTGDWAVTSESLSDAEVQAAFMAQIRIAYPSAPDPTSFIRTQWCSDPYARGSYSVPATFGGSQSDIELMHTRVTPSLGFAGEHTSICYYSSVHGAHNEGRRMAAWLVTGSAGGDWD